MPWEARIQVLLLIFLLCYLYAKSLQARLQTSPQQTPCPCPSGSVWGAAEAGQGWSGTLDLHGSPECEQQPLGSAPSASAPRCYSALFPDRELSRISRSLWGCQEESSPADLIIKALSAMPDFRTIAACFPKH